jgi:hypothetical protein
LFSLALTGKKRGFSSAEGRDKLTKMVQYASRALAHYLSNEDKVKRIKVLMGIPLIPFDAYLFF